MEAFTWFENTWLSTWVRESPPVFPSILVAHALGMGALAGVNVFIGLRALGVMTIPGAALDRFASIMWTGFVASLGSGVLLLAAYPAKALTNPVFFLKFVFMIGGFVLANALRKRLRSDDVARPDRSMQWSGACLLLLWAAVIAAGRLLAYTHTVLLASHLQ